MWCIEVCSNAARFGLVMVGVSVSFVVESPIYGFFIFVVFIILTRFVLMLFMDVVHFLQAGAGSVSLITTGKVVPSSSVPESQKDNNEVKVCLEILLLSFHLY